MMRFRGGGVGHSSTRAATDTFKNDRDKLDIVSHQARKVQRTHSDMEEGDSLPEDALPPENALPPEDALPVADDDGIFLDGERDMEGDVDEEGQLSESELVDYGYEQKIDSEEEEEEEEDNDDRESGEEDDTTTIDELATLGYADY
jgi:hypothetical protein